MAVQDVKTVKFAMNFCLCLKSCVEFVLQKEKRKIYGGSIKIKMSTLLRVRKLSNYF